MVFICDNCGLSFSRNSVPDRCPDCGRPMIRSAGTTERQEFAVRMAELVQDRYTERSRFPNLVETEISTLNCFSFKLPATALQIDSDMVVELIVEYGENAADKNDLTANVWAKQEDGMVGRFLMSVHLLAQPKETLSEQKSRVFAVLSGNATFQARLFNFVTAQLKQRI